MTKLSISDMLTAWGETKSVADWALDERATADAPIILRRYETHGIAESAIGFKAADKAVVAPRRGELFAFGRFKTIGDWAMDVHCVVTVNTLRARLKSGWELEAALSTPSRSHGVVRKKHDEFARIEAFGEVKSALEWTRDPRCKVTLSGLRNRLKAGAEVERAITTPPTRKGSSDNYQWKAPELVELDGKSLTIEQWSREPECLVTASTVRTRLKQGYDFRRALTEPPSHHGRPAKKGALDYTVYEAFGESKMLHEWASDSRCKVSINTLANRLKSGYSLVDAMQTDIRGLMYGKVRELHSAFGESKTLPEWARDERAQVTLVALRKRLGFGWTMERALSTPPHDHDMLHELKSGRITAFGETKTPQQWVSDERCKVAYHTLVERIRAGMQPELAITVGPKDAYIKESKLRPMAQSFTIFGETKTMREWTEDPRCVVNTVQVRDRLRSGWDLERAISTPLLTPDENLRTMVAKLAKMVTAFGETKSLADWARDPRARVERKILGHRIAKGMLPEKAITTPPYQL